MPLHEAPFTYPHARPRSFAAQRDLPEVAQSVAIIMDGNGRWAPGGSSDCGRPRAGARTVRPIVEAALELGIHDLVGLRVLDRELVAREGRGRGTDGDLRRDDRA